MNHCISLLGAAKDAQVPETFIHFIGDGRDTSPRSAATYLDQLIATTTQLKYGKLATMVGRYYAMDRDKRWERVQIAYDALVHGVGEHALNPRDALQARYAADQTDEFLKPIILCPDLTGTIQSGDSVILFNYRSDRMRELSLALMAKDATDMPFESKTPPPTGLYIASMTQYKADFPFPTIFPPQTMDNVLGEWLDKMSISQCHVAETEKYAHVTFFFNGGTEAQYALEDRELIASPKVATYDLKPEMSAIEVANKVCLNGSIL